MSSESSLWQWLSGARQHYRDSLHMCRVENAVGVGAADVEGVLHGAAFNIELKHAPRPKRGGPLRFGSPLRPSQRDWGKARWLAGGSYSFLIQVGSGPERGLYLIEGSPENIDALYAGVNEAWCVERNVLDKSKPERVVWLASNMETRR